MIKLSIVTAVLALGLLASCGDSGSGLSGACAELAGECAMCNDILERELCFDVAEDNDQEDCAVLLADPCL